MSKSTVSPATAAQVRAFYNDPTKGAARIASLTDATCVRPGARGRLSPEAINGYNKGKPVARRYVSGATKTAVAAQKDAAKQARDAAMTAGLPVGKRGPLSNAARKAAGLPVAKRKASVKKG